LIGSPSFSGGERRAGHDHAANVREAGGCALVAYAGAPRFLLRAAHAADASGKVLVAIFQRGAVDGLSM